jgi:tetratricopeptide (TPR) repeat protein
MDRLLRILADGVHRLEGTVNQYTGDGIMALFGAPLAHEDHAQRACYAALGLREELRRYTDELRRSRGLGFAVRMGLNSGEVVVGKIGDDLRMDYTAHGQTVGLAARMEQLAHPGTVYLTASTARRVEGYFELRDLGAFEIKGAAEPIPVFELEGVGPLRTRFDASRARGLSRFVGRERELAALEEALADVAKGEPRIVGLVGEAGVGKSRLVHEFRERCDPRVPCNAGHCAPHTQSIPLLPIIESYRNYFDIRDEDNAETRRVKITGRLLRVDSRLAEDLPFVLDFLGVPDPESPTPELEPPERIERLARIANRIGEKRAERHEYGIRILEDLHWMDDATEAYTTKRHLANPGSWAGTLHLFTYRPEYQPPWAGLAHFRELSLEPLSAERVDELLRDLLGADAAGGELGEMIRERSGGNPFFVEEIVQTLAESGALAGSRGDYVLTRPVAEFEVPESVQAVLAARIDRLPEREKAVLQAASVIGEIFPENQLRAIAGLPEPELRDALQTLAAAGLVYERTLYPRLEYAFQHAQTRDVAYDSQLGDARARSHAAVARSIESSQLEREGEHSALLAHHWELAREPTRAAPWALRAAVWSRHSDADEAVRHYRKVLELVDRDGQDEDSTRWILAACIGLLRSGLATGLEADEPRLALRRGRAAAEHLGSRTELVELLGAYGLIRGVLGEAALEEAREAARLADELGDSRLRVRTLLDLSRAEFLAGRSLENAVDAIEAALVEAPDDRRALAWRGRLLADAGRLDEARRDTERAGELMPESAPAASHIEHLLRRAMLEFRWGAVDAAESLGARLLELSERHQDHFGIAQALAMLGDCYLRTQRHGQAVDCLTRLVDVIRGLGVSRFLEFFCLAALARAHQELGQSEPAREIVASCVERAGRVIDARVNLAFAMIGLSEPGDLAQAEAYLERAEQAAEANGSLYFLAPFLECRAALERRRGDEPAGLRQLRAAQNLYAEMGATGHAQRLARELES